ncbi:MOSC domain-containing protein [Isoptericola sp. NEAU-Y5]|uniref:MOSC domain-containing protein n=1 Tax=Isoptericola luteus TaxID=2879484 RepID=A0ABS7ZAG9_9MICO|nr:MOSC domain-containing protein [Isoptericola sp. NEAU-Y5]MCA5891883.1 MOSC domain-containing protein [Isoptericola sp. NEAU-Y5]
MADLLAVCRVYRLLPDAGTVGVTAIDKRPVGGPVKVTPYGLYADVQADRRDHGGLDQAVYAYAQEDAEVWGAELGYDVVPGLFGENLRTRGVDVNGAVIGERWRIGSALLEVTQPRTPCQTFARHLKSPPRWVRRFTEANRTGAYLRVVEKGSLSAGDAVDVVERPAHGVTVAGWFGAWSGLDGAPHPVEPARLLLAAHDAGQVRLSKDMHSRARGAVQA